MYLVLTDDNVNDLHGDRRLEIIHDLKNALVFLISKFNVDVSLEECLDNVHLATDGGLVESSSTTSPHIDVKASGQDHGHHFPGEINRKFILEF